MIKLRESKLYRYFSIALVVVALGFAAWITVRESARIPWKEFSFSPWLLGLSLLVSTIGFLPAVFAWRTILARYGISQGFWEDLRNYVYTMLGTLIPGGIWQIAGRTAAYKRSKQSGFHVAVASVDELIFFSLAGWLIFSVLSLIFPAVNPLKNPLFGVLILAVIAVVSYPGCFNALHAWLFRLFKRDTSGQLARYSWDAVLICTLWEILTLSIGCCSLYLLLVSFYPTGFIALFYMATAYCFSVSFANLFFWLPGSLILKDGAMAPALTTFMPASFAIICVVIIRIWTVFTVVVPFALVWLVENTLRRSVLKV